MKNTVADQARRLFALDGKLIPIPLDAGPLVFHLLYKSRRLLVGIGKFPSSDIAQLPGQIDTPRTLPGQYPEMGVGLGVGFQE